MHRTRWLMASLAFAWAIAAGVPAARAWLRRPYEDAVVIERSELIVVGGVKDGSVQFVSHQRPGWNEGGISWEHHAILVVHRVLKGKSDQKEIPIVIHYGLEPMVGGEGTHDELKPRAVAGGIITLYDSGSHEIEPLWGDLRKDNIWCLRRIDDRADPSIPVDAQKLAKLDLGIEDPEDLQVLALEDYLTCYLGKDPEAAVRKQLAKQPEIAERATRYLEHQELQRLLKIPDAAQRVERLLPYYVGRTAWNGQWDARPGIIAAGSVAGPYLLAVYQSTQDHNISQDVVQMWGQIRWHGCVDILTNVLKEEDEFWANQKLPPGWWRDNSNAYLKQSWAENYSDVFTAVSTLDRIRDPAARQAVELTRQRWAAIDFGDRQIVKACDSALRHFPEEPSAPATAPAAPR